jgi:hypothetical protein
MTIKELEEKQRFGMSEEVCFHGQRSSKIFPLENGIV